MEPLSCILLLAPVVGKKRKEDRAMRGEGQRKETKNDLSASMHEDTLFFDRLLEHIPTRFLLPHDDGAGKVWFNGLHKEASASFKKRSQENLRKAQKQHLGDSLSFFSTMELLRKTTNSKACAEGEEGESDAALPAFVPDRDNEHDHGGSMTYEELLHRLRRRTELLRVSPNTRDPTAGGKSGKGGRNQRKNRKGLGLGKGGWEAIAGSREKKTIDKKEEESSKESASGRQVGKKGKKRKGSEVREPEEGANRLKQATDDASISEKHPWSEVPATKVQNNPKLLKQGTEKEKKRRQKSSEKWKEKIDVMEKNKSADQETPAGHVEVALEKKKKMDGIARGEKKLMRPGFEGRKRGFINETSL